MRIQRRNHQESAHRDHPDDRHDFFSAGLLHDLDLIDDPVQAACQSICPRPRQASKRPAESAAITIDKESRIFLNKEEVDQAALGDLPAPTPREELRSAGRHQRRRRCRAWPCGGSHGHRPCRQRGEDGDRGETQGAEKMNERWLIPSFTASS